MKGLLVAILLLSAGIADAGYFRFFDPNHPQPAVGAFKNLKTGDGAVGFLIPVITHSPKDGCLLPSIVCLDWSPLAIGAKKRGDTGDIAVGAGFNLLPLVQGLGTKVLDLIVSKPAAPGLRELLKPTQSGSTVDIRISLWPSLLWDTEHHKTYSNIFVGPQILF